MHNPEASKEIFSFIYLKKKPRKLNRKSLMAVFSKYMNVVLTPFLIGGLQFLAAYSGYIHRCLHMCRHMNYMSYCHSHLVPIYDDNSSPSLSLLFVVSCICLILPPQNTQSIVNVLQTRPSFFCVSYTRFCTLVIFH